MITEAVLHRFLANVSGQPIREGTRYAREARVLDFAGSAASVTTVVRGATGEYDVALWSEHAELAYRCSCPSWRDPCKHVVAAAMVLRQTAAPESPTSGSTERLPLLLAATDPEAARRVALEERRASGRREKLRLSRDEPPYVVVTSPSGFSYRVRLRGGHDGPHSCVCPDFEANRLHTCKHVERVRRALHGRRSPAWAEHERTAARPHVYLHFGEVVEPRLFGRPRGSGAPAVRADFDDAGLPLRPLAADDRKLARYLGRLGRWVDPDALAWTATRVARRPVLPAVDIQKLVPTLGLDPYPYQWDGASFLARSGRALLADEMGLGKTIQAILAATALRHARAPVERVTIVCPASLRGGWQDEIERWLGEQATLLAGPRRARADLIASRPRWLITHYEQVRRDHEDHRANPPDLLIIDEAQRAKGLQTRTARVLKAIDARHVFALTGTPLENRLEEAYAIAQLIDQRLLPPLWQLDRDHFVREENRHRVVMYRKLSTLRSQLQPAFLRRRKEDVALDLPEQLRSIAMLPMHPAVTETYGDAMTSVARIARKKHLLPADFERITRLLVIARRCCNGPHMLGQPVDDRKVPKLDELAKALRDLCLGEGRKAVVFSEWTDMTDRVEALCKRLRLPSFHLHGGVPVRRRPALIRAFTDEPGAAVFISTDAGGVGLNLQAAEVLINLDLPWNPARLEQRIARIHRIGSKRAIQVLLLITKDSVEEHILLQHDTKRNVLANIWAADGDDTIAAPGGSGAFRDMLAALLEAEAPRLAAGATREALAPEPAAEVRATTGRGLDSAEVAADGAPGSPTHLGEHRPAAPTPVTVDPGALTALVSGLTPILPSEQRRALGALLGALGAALCESAGSDESPPDSA